MLKQISLISGSFWLPFLSGWFCDAQTNAIKLNIQEGKPISNSFKLALARPANNVSNYAVLQILGFFPTWYYANQAEKSLGLSCVLASVQHLGIQACSVFHFARPLSVSSQLGVICASKPFLLGSLKELIYMHAFVNPDYMALAGFAVLSSSADEVLAKSAATLNLHQANKQVNVNALLRFPSIASIASRTFYVTASACVVKISQSLCSRIER